MALPALLIFGVVVLLGLLFTKVLDNSDVAEADFWVDRELAENRTPTGNDLTHYGSLLGETPTIIGLTVLVAIIFRAVFKRWRESVIVVLCVSGQALIFMLTQMLIDRGGRTCRGWTTRRRRRASRPGTPRRRPRSTSASG